VKLYLPCIELELNFRFYPFDPEVYYPKIYLMYKALKPTVQDLNRADSDAILAGYHPKTHKVA
jgi:hypothetical protein